MDLSKIQKILIIGLGPRTGVAASNFLARKGYAVVVSDSKDRAALTDALAALDRGVRVIAGAQRPELLDEGFDLAVLSPGVPRAIPLVAAAVERGVPVVSEIELAYRFAKGLIVAITGTDGKTTTTSLVGHILAALGIDTFVGGNIGVPFVSFVDRTRDSSVTVLELSSFQLETIDRFRPDVAAILNIAPDHLDRYATMDEYVDAKLRIAMNQRPDDVFVHFADDALIRSRLGAVVARTCGFAVRDTGAAIRFDGSMVRLAGVDAPVLDPTRMRIIGVHNVQNAMAAILMVRAVLARMGRPADDGAIAEAIYSFKGLPHRMEIVGEFEGRTFINDSKATTVNAVEMALASLTRPAVLILGGRTKGDDYARLNGPIAQRVKRLLLIGESTPEFARLFAAHDPVPVATLEEALAQAMRHSAPGDAVLYSPATASFDMFRNYEERGDRFRETFQRLVRGEIAWT